LQDFEGLCGSEDDDDDPGCVFDASAEASVHKLWKSCEELGGEEAAKTAAEGAPADEKTKGKELSKAEQ
jgi:hypothetical protein